MIWRVISSFCWTTPARMRRMKKKEEEAYLDYHRAGNGSPFIVFSPFSNIPRAKTYPKFNGDFCLHAQFLVKPIDGKLGSANSVRVTPKSRTLVIVKASAEIDGTGATSSDPPAEGEKLAVSVENLPLESKFQEKLDQKLRMKLAKKIRLRRKRLVRKRQLRKKGRWPPSKMKKLKNV